MKQLASSALLFSRAHSIFLFFSQSIFPTTFQSIFPTVSRSSLLATPLFIALLLPTPSLGMDQTKALMDKHQLAAEQVGAIFVKACQQGDVRYSAQTVQALMPFVDTQTKELGLIVASQNNRERLVILLLLQSGVNPNCMVSGITPLRQASNNGHLGIVKALVIAKADIEKRDEQDYAPAHVASANGHAEIVQFFIEQGAQKIVTAKTKVGCTPLHLACAGGRNTVTKLLLRNMEKADINAVDNSGATALCIAVQNQHFKCAMFLRGALADVTIPNVDGCLAIHAAAQNGFLVPELLRDCLQTVNAVNKHGITPLHMAAAHDKLTAAKTLLQAKADVTLKDANGKAPLDCATSQAMKKLIEEYPAREEFLEQLQECVLDGAEEVLHSLYPQNGGDSEPEEEEEEEKPAGRESEELEERKE